MTGRIAPDKGNEIDLVIAGDKPLAVIEKSKDPEQYARALRMQADQFSYAAVTPWIGPEGPEVVVYILHSTFHKYRDALALPEGNERTRKLGRLFGYSEADIEVFINAKIDCYCSKCSGISKFGPETDRARRTQFHAK